ncbi:TRAP transporter substrate-binding protein [Sphaerospermopsis sp. LEGE 08334]|jgi:TRAP-type mannitol/chloroaromatic compound transport system substrate-binding protein|uniref:TRAP transporter substrate-binding protein n=1 Tax=Sphaerospermopsis sp. LEGE 08334 TaxID=1828651 RepID=UPI0018820722|nr:TRAP transporter substrate-binding protein [Sphaerospermopsis sp. LEGE 08334]MBE9058046.1 TRAP transporter substrate-binding protein [Sphaerospermopsis sp. LEGE 08334]
MKRRQIINTGAIATATAVLTTACARKTTSTATQSSLPTVRWRMATSWTKTLGTYIGADTIAKRVKEMSGGRFTITPFVAGEIVPGLQVLDAVQAGTVECGHTASYYYIGKNPALAFATSVPFGFNAQQQNAWLYQGGGLEALQKIYSDFNIINFPAGNTGVQMGGWFKKEIKTVSDLNGLKMRIPGLGGQVMSRLGVNVQVLPGGEIYLALDRGAIDAAEWVGPYDDEKLGLNKAAQFYYYPGWWEPGPTLDVLVNLNAWNKLPKEYQEIFKTAAVEANVNMFTKYDALNGEAMTRLVAGGTKLTPYSQEIMEAAQKASFDIYEENASKDATFKEIYEGWKKFREQIYTWNKTNELSYANFVTANSK